MSGRLIQFASGINPDDAVSKHLAEIHRGVAQGYSAEFSQSKIFAEAIHPQAPAPAQKPERYRRQRGDCILIHYSMALNCLPALLALRAPLAIYYQNLSPAATLRDWNLALAGKLERARSDLRQLSGRAALAMAASEFSARELEALSIGPTHRIDLLIPDLPGAARRRAPFQGRSLRLLFAGRLLPHKGHDRLLQLMYYLARLAPGAQLVLAGDTPRGLELYATALRNRARLLRIEDRIEWRGFTTRAELEALYAECDAFVCASSHEGFCAPLLEAMAADLPVFCWTRPRSAVSDTMQDAGVDLGAESPERAAAIIAEFWQRPDLCESIVAQQRARMKRYDPAASLSRILSLLDRIQPRYV
ncbi:MAG: glycosyltransferase family 4 protein [Leptospirales bacterium]|nr:glycosyltransferase family 4 protein [Leptospirales bacterium]